MEPGRYAASYRPTERALPLLDKAGVEANDSVIALGDGDAGAFTDKAKSRRWNREPKVRMLA